MSKLLLTHGFKWMSDDELENSKEMPCTLHIDLEYSGELHNDYPLAPQNIKPPDSNVTKPIPNLRNKDAYVAHHVTLKLLAHCPLQ